MINYIKSEQELMSRSKENSKESSNESNEEIYGNDKKKKGDTKSKHKLKDQGLWTRVVRINDDGLQYTNIASVPEDLLNL